MAKLISRRAVVSAGLGAIGSGLSAGTLAAADGETGAGRNPLTIESLGTLLKALGLTATKTESRYDFAFAARHGEEWTLSMSVVLSTDDKSIWIMAWLDELPQSAGDVPRTALLRLLSDNDKIGNGMFFAYVASNRRFVLQRVLKNDAITSASFKADLLELGAAVVNTYPHWAVTNWKQLGTAGAGKGKDVDDDDQKSAGSRPASPQGSRSAAREPATGTRKK